MEPAGDQKDMHGFDLLGPRQVQGAGARVFSFGKWRNPYEGRRAGDGASKLFPGDQAFGSSDQEAQKPRLRGD